MDLRQGEGKCLKYLERGWNRKEGRGHKDFKKGVKLGQWEGALKRWGDGTPLRTTCNQFIILNNYRYKV